MVFNSNILLVQKFCNKKDIYIYIIKKKKKRVHLLYIKLKT